ATVMPPVGTMLPSEADIRISVPVLVFTIAITFIAGLLFGSAPALQAARLDLNEVLKLGGRTGSGGARRNARRALVIAEFSLALTLLASGGLALKSFWNLTRIDLGIRTDHVLSFRLPVPEQRLKSPEEMKSYYRQMLDQIGAVPGVRNVAAMTGVPAGGSGSGVRFTLVGQPVANPSERLSSSIQMVTPGYVDTLGIRVTKGRSIDSSDTDASPRVAMVNEYFVNRFLRGADPLTQRILMDVQRPGSPPAKPVEWQIVGVFHDVRGSGARRGRYLWGGGFRRGPTHSRIWSAYRTRSAATESHRSGLKRRNGPGCHRRTDRIGRRLSGGPGHAINFVRSRGSGCASVR